MKFVVCKPIVFNIDYLKGNKEITSLTSFF